MLDIESFINRRFDDTLPYGNPVSDLRVNCPFCDTVDHKFHLYINLDKPMAHCFRCGYSKDWVGFVIDITGYNYYRAIGELYKKPRMADFEKSIRIKLHDPDTTPPLPYRVQLPEDFTNLAELDTPIARMAKRYLSKKRGFDDWYIERYNLGLAESIPYRIIIPIEGDYWQGRKLYKWMEPKYTNPPLPAGNVIFNSDALYKYDEIVICEGAFSAMAVGQNAIALISKEPTDMKLKRIKDSTASRFIIALEPGAFGSMGKLADVLYASGREVIIWNFTTGDPNDPAQVSFRTNYDFKTKLAMRFKY